MKSFDKLHSFPLLILYLCLFSSYCFAEENDQTCTFPLSDDISINIILPKTVTAGRSIYITFEIINKSKSTNIGIMENILRQPILIIKNDQGEIIPYTREGNTMYDNSTKVLYQGKFIPLAEYLKIVNPRSSLSKEKNIKSENAPSHYRNRFFEIKANQKLKFTINLANIYDMSIPSTYKLSFKKDFLVSILKMKNIPTVDEISLEIINDNNTLNFSVVDCD